MVAAGLDTLPGNINMTIAYLSSEHGQQIQNDLYEDIQRCHPGGDAWKLCVEEERSELMQSFVKVLIARWWRIKVCLADDLFR